MKKFIILLLVILPIFLIITISFAGRIFSIYNYIYVEKVVFVNDLEEELDEDFVLKLNKGQSQQTSIKIFPELSTNKNVKYTSQDSTIATVNEYGVVKGIGFGTTRIMVATVDSNKVDTLLVSITDDNVSGIEIAEDVINLGLGQSSRISVIISPETAINKNVSWKSENPAVASVNSSGRVSAVSAGEAVITATTADGGFVASVLVVVAEVEDFKFTLPTKGTAKVAEVQEKEIILKDYIEIINTDIALNDIKFFVVSGEDSIEELNETTGYLVFEKSNRVTISAYVGNKDNPAYEIEINLYWLS